MSAYVGNKFSQKTYVVQNKMHIILYSKYKISDPNKLINEKLQNLTKNWFEIIITLFKNIDYMFNGIMVIWNAWTVYL